MKNERKNDDPRFIIGIAACARRIIRLRDGRIESDIVNTGPALAHLNL